MRNLIKQQRRYDKLNQVLGPAILSYLSSPDILEVHLNPDGRLWTRDQNGFKEAGETLEPLQARELIGSLADHAGLVANEREPTLEVELPFLGYRFEGFLPPIVTAPAFSIRKSSGVLLTLDNYIDQKVITAHQADILRGSIYANESILIAGGPGSGKTTFANALLNEMVLLGDPNQRFIIIEDTRELQCSAVNKLPLKTYELFKHQQLLTLTLRASPDRVVIGECRGEEMHTVLQAWNTGTRGGLATIHANSARSALLRVKDLAEQAGQSVSPQLIVESIQCIVAMSFDPRLGRRVDEIIQVIDYKDNDYVLQSC